MVYAQKRRGPARRRATTSSNEKADALAKVDEILGRVMPGHAVDPEHYFVKPWRGWRFDRALVGVKIALEYEGGIFGKGGTRRRCPTCKRAEGGAHSSVTGIVRDIDKYNAAIALGWRVLRANPLNLKDGSFEAALRLLWTGAHPTTLFSVLPKRYAKRSRKPSAKRLGKPSAEQFAKRFEAIGLPGTLGQARHETARERFLAPEWRQKVKG